MKIIPYDKLEQTFLAIASPFQAEQNVQAAEFHGISVFDLINSPNYTVLVKSYRESRVLDLVQSFEEQGYSNKVAWAVICLLYEKCGIDLSLP